MPELWPADQQSHQIGGTAGDKAGGIKGSGRKAGVVCGAGGKDCAGRAGGIFGSGGIWNGVARKLVGNPMYERHDLAAKSGGMAAKLAAAMAWRHGGKVAALRP
eukprot:gene16838-biopygen13173